MGALQERMGALQEQHGYTTGMHGCTTRTAWVHYKNSCIWEQGRGGGGNHAPSCVNVARASAPTSPAMPALQLAVGAAAGDMAGAWLESAGPWTRCRRICRASSGVTIPSAVQLGVRSWHSSYWATWHQCMQLETTPDCAAICPVATASTAIASSLSTRPAMPWSAIEGGVLRVSSCECQMFSHIESSRGSSSCARR